MTEIYFQKMTPDGYHEIEAQIETLKQKRPTLIARLKAARALGDLSENTEYSSAKRDLRHLESRLRYLDKQLKYAQIINPRKDEKIDLGSFVTIEFLDDHSQTEYQLVGRQEANLQANKLAFDSPLGNAISHQQAGAIVTVPAPDGNYQVKILSIRLAN
ncbi:transcription elongation factor GreA [Lactobacillus sp. 3B(2020)]|uniref:transcription elongation factor GreA n=1 Tax=Lactobacillus sp. 3B(2020) TaxID=2695882 RepID=UPI0015DE78C1|nr:transcription elongation factor GreA [Lactobacillus sp. 3B(2020)]QLL70903.1 transcription elongation factor GreA [Lactobacillus sp. 3B(2020)]